MTTTYNVNIVGNLTNTNGVLSGFSLNDYATLPETLEGLTISSLEIVFKFKTNSLQSDNAIFWTDKLIDTPSVAWSGLRLCNYNVDGGVFDLEITDNNTQLDDIYDTTAILPNKYYYIKMLYHSTSGYKLYKSEDGENYTLVGTSAVTTIPSNSYALIGRAVDTDPIPLDGSIDLNESYIKVNGSIWWRGVENITRIQLRHDTAANWTSVNPILLEGEVGIETDTRKQKFGDGVTAWNSLPYDKGSTALQSIASSDVTTALGYTPVNKAGDTMTGNLNFTTSSSNPNIRQVTTLSDATLGTLPSVDYYSGFQTKDSQGTEFANVNCSYKTNGRIGSNFYVARSDSGSTVSGSMGVYIDEGGTEAYAVINCPTTINNGLLSVSSSEITVGNLIHAKTEVATSKGTIPSADCFQGILFEDSDSSHTTWQSNRLGACQMRLTSTGDTEVSLYAYRNVADSSSGAAQLRLVAPQTGDVYCTVPAPPSNSNSTNAATTAWVHTKINEAFSYNSSTGTLTLGL